jgi:hypothetical protein
MRLLFKLGFVTALLGGNACRLAAQDLAPRAYVITPLQSNAVTLTYGFYSGDILLDGALPVSNATGNLSIPVFSYYHSLNFFGRSANVIVALPYGVGYFHGDVVGSTKTEAYRSGLMDSVFRFSVNLKGGPAMNLGEFRQWKEKTIVGLSFKVVAPTGQYDPNRPLNWGTNRWSFKPELGYSHRWKRWVVDGYGAVWFFTDNGEFFLFRPPGQGTQSQKPVLAFETHLSYDIKPRLWFSLDGNFWYGGRTSVNSVENSYTLQSNSRVGATISTPLTKHQSVKLSYNLGAYINYGGAYRNLSVAWQYSWLGKPR